MRFFYVPPSLCACHVRVTQLFANRITTLGGLDNLEKLQVLSVGNNLIAQVRLPGPNRRPPDRLPCSHRRCSDAGQTHAQTHAAACCCGLYSAARLRVSPLQLDNVMYLRPFTRLQAVNLVGNPFCQEDEYRR